MNKVISLVIILLILPTVLAINVTIEKEDAHDVVIMGLNNPAIFDLKITNNEKTDEFYIFNLLGFTMEPKELISIEKDKSKDIRLTVYPRPDLKELGIKNYYSFKYFIRGKDSTEQEEKIIMKVIDLKDAFVIGSGEIDPESNSLDIYIHNKENFDFKDLKVKFSSKFFELEEQFDLDAYQRKDFNIELDKEDFKKLIAGFYTLYAEVSMENLTSEIEGIIKFVEKDIIEEIKKEQGFIVSTVIIEKTNNGNALSKSETVIKKNIISRLFTSFSPEPNAIERDGVTVYYTWNKELKPGETLQITVKTNWLYPLLLIIFVIAIIILVKRYTFNDVIIRKRVSYVKAKGGEFALKVSLFLHTKNYVERVNIVDRLPSLMKIYERFGGEKPSRINEANRLIEWDFEKLEAGEVRTLSYIIYSKNVGVMGKFALPSATAIYQKDGEVKESTSNKAFFITEQRTGDIEE